MMKYKKTCVMCGNEFETNIKKKMNCSSECASAYHNMKCKEANQSKKGKASLKRRKSLLTA